MEALLCAGIDVLDGSGLRGGGLIEIVQAIPDGLDLLLHVPLAIEGVSHEIKEVGLLPVPEIAARSGREWLLAGAAHIL